MQRIDEYTLTAALMICVIIIAVAIAIVIINAVSSLMFIGTIEFVLRSLRNSSLRMLQKTIKTMGNIQMSEKCYASTVDIDSVYTHISP